VKLAEKQRLLTLELAALKSGQDRLAYLVDRARHRPVLPTEQRVEANRISGCLAKLWLVAEFHDGDCFFACDSDSLVVKAVAGLLCEFYSGQAPAEILSRDPSFLGPLGITQHLTPNRRNALSRVWEQIQQFANVHEAEATARKTVGQTGVD
jgi:cysteine desulfuration protein SufE